MLNVCLEDTPQIVAAKAQLSANGACIYNAQTKLHMEVKRLSTDPDTGYEAYLVKTELPMEAYIREVQHFFTQELQDAISAIHLELSNDLQRVVFQCYAAKIKGAFIVALQFHALDAYRKLKVQNFRDEISSAISKAEQHWNVPDIIDQCVRAISSASWQISQLPGYGSQPLAVDSGILQLTSAMHVRVIQAALENNNRLYAEQYVRLYKAGITSEDLLRLQHAIHHFTASAPDDSLQRAATYSLRT